MRVKFVATYRQITGCKSCEMPAPDDVLSLLKALKDRWPEFRYLLNEDGTDASDYVSIVVSGRYIEHLDGVATKLAEQDEVVITPVVSGG
ncbi:MAG: MoaD/ThiS family protein [Eggerthellaceae bacterium]|nr:MoaD/ThiS family protein [Eggerthellaceae bacterium]MBQ6454874.1 MoaD family protein [Eggerthellaceae bacterium]